MNPTLCARLVALVLSAIPATAFAVGGPLESAYWRFEEGAAAAPVDASNSNAVTDSINANHMRTFSTGTAPTYTSSVPAPTVPQTHAADNRSLSFAGNQDIYADGKTIDNPNSPISAFTLEVSFNLSTIGNGIYQALVGKDGKPTASTIAPLSFKARGDTGNLQIEILDGAGTPRQVQSASPLAPSHWYHAAAIDDGSTLSLYLDSNDGNGYVYQGNAPVTGGALYASNSPWTIGRGQFNGNNTDWVQGGLIDEVRLSNVALHPEELLFHAPTGVWNASASGSWSDPTKWRSALPSAAGDTAILRAVTLPDPITITLDSDRTIGNLIVENSAKPYTIAGTHTLTLQAPGAAQATVRVDQTTNSANILAPVVLASDTVINTPAGQAYIYFAHTSSSHTLIKSGPGTLSIDQADIHDLALEQGTTLLGATSTAASTITNLTFSGGVLQPRQLIIDYPAADPSPESQIRIYIQIGALQPPNIPGGNPQITHSLATAEASQILNLTAPATTTWHGAPVDATSLLILYTYTGDLNLDGLLTADDYALLDRATALNLPASWSTGDLNYDDVVDATDYLLLDQNYAALHPGSLTPAFLSERESQFGQAYVSELLTSIPEPSSILYLLSSLPLLTRRRTLKSA